MYYMLLFISLVIALSAYTLFLYNKIIPAQNEAQNNWQLITVLLQKRANVVPHLLELYRQAGVPTDKNLLEILSKIRSYVRLHGNYTAAIKDRIVLECDLTEKLSLLLDLAKENSTINTSTHFINMQKMLMHIDEQLKKTIEQYNLAATEINKEFNFILNKFLIHFFEIEPLDTISSKLLFASA